jgi:hypothetical protein
MGMPTPTVPAFAAAIEMDNPLIEYQSHNHEINGSEGLLTTFRTCCRFVT